MIMLYMIPSVISWHNPFTPISFIITTLLCGIILIGAITGKTDYWFNRAAAFIITALIILSVANSVIFHGSYLKEEISLFIIRIILSVIALVITSLRIFRTGTNKTSVWWVILFVVVISSEIINRFMFFLSFEKSGL
jgi:DMSO reductase anchor subunit